MVQSAVFWLILAIAIGGNWLLPAGRRPAWLVLISVTYLLLLDAAGIAPLLGWVLAIWLLRRRIAASDAFGRWLVVGLIVSVVVQLAYFKYLPPLLSLFEEGPARHVVVPLGISFITFRLIHYILETRRGTLPPHGAWDYLSWASLFTIWTAGPIERIDHFLSNREEQPTAAMFAEGLTRIILGLSKKFVLGMQLIPMLFGDITSGQDLIALLSHISTFEAWRFLILSFFLFYLDFSAYSDIAIGSSRLLGLRIMENFNWPILASNPSLYWKRWHMTLSGWCQSYVYMPVIGLTRNPYLAVFAAFTCIGLWHSGSWNWLAWGLYHATAVTLFQTWTRFRRKRRWKFFDKPWLRYPGIVVTVCYTSVAQAFTIIQGIGHPFDGLRILAKLIFIDIAI
ncbi:MAG: MBOAT family O-acyltransferase [Azospirillaceae bacterium]|nr:MBOAT family O-acyltransferase [Azospirillaceae bacterium]